MSASYKEGQWVVYRKSKFSGSPGPRASDVHPTSKGDGYAYTVNKFWVVERIADDGELVLRTRRGKQHRVSPEDGDLRPASWWERWLFKSRFEAVENGDSRSSNATTPG